MSSYDDFDRRREESRQYDNRMDEIRRRYENNRKRTSSIIDGMRTSDYSKAYRELEIPPNQSHQNYNSSALNPHSELETLSPAFPQSSGIIIPSVSALIAIKCNVDDKLGLPKKTVRRLRKAVARLSGIDIADSVRNLVRSLSICARKREGLKLYKVYYAKWLKQPETLSELLKKPVSLAESLVEGNKDFSDIDPSFELTYRMREMELNIRMQQLRAELQPLIENVIRIDTEKRQEEEAQKSPIILRHSKF